MVAFQARVDPRPVRPPAMGLLASANNVVVGHDVEIQENATVGKFNFNEAHGPGEPPAPALPRDSVTGEKVDAETYRQQFISSQAPDDYETPAIGARVRWISGFAYRPEICNGGDIIDPNGTTVGSPPTMESQINVTPYVVEGIDQRSTFGTPGEGEYAEAQGYARRQLLACEGKQIEEELWKGTLSTAKGWGNRYLADSNVDLVEGDRLLGYYTALGALERAIKDGTCGQQAMIHARADTITIWDQANMLRRVGNLILTIHDTIVVPGAGYDGSAPLAPLANGKPFDPHHSRQVPGSDSAWAYATTVVDVRRSDFITPQTILERLDYQHNTLTTYERRVAAATWGCLHVGVHVDHTAGTSVSGS
jgi:hypothetical protein